MDTKNSTATVPHPSTEERPCACLAGVVYVGHMIEDPETSEETEAFEAVPCRRCADSR